MLGALSTAVVQARASSSPTTSTARGGGIAAAGGQRRAGGPRAASRAPEAGLFVCVSLYYVSAYKSTLLWAGGGGSGR